MKTFTHSLQFKRESGCYEAIICGVTADLLELEAIMNDILSTHELEAVAKLQFEKRRLTFLLGRFAAKTALAKLLGVDPKDSIEVKSGFFGQPIVFFAGREQIAVSIAHTDHSAVAIAFPVEHPLGIDLEVINPGNRITLDTEFTPLELRFYDTVFSDDQDVGATVLWTAKEAMSKCIKTGLMTPLRVFEISEIQKLDACYHSTFTNFGQYKAQSFVLEDSVLTIVMPRKSALVHPLNRPFSFE